MDSDKFKSQQDFLLSLLIDQLNVTMQTKEMKNLEDVAKKSQEIYYNLENLQNSIDVSSAKNLNTQALQLKENVRSARIKGV